MNIENRIITVGQLSDLLKSAVESYDFFSSIYVAGEVANCKSYSSGHTYFTLKDERSAVSCVIFRNSLERMKFEIEDGMKIVAHGNISVYTPQGRISFIVDNAEPQGLGALYLAFSRLKEKLEKEGLFDESRKKTLPLLPGRVGIITSAGGAALQDILEISGRRFPSVEIIIYPSLVQGDSAPAELCEGIKYFGDNKNVDVIIIGRGGGSFEDLNAFNDERLCRMCAECDIPIVSAVGHETDYTIIDYVSDLRAPTPSAAAELVFPDRNVLIDNVKNISSALTESIRSFLDNKREFFNDSVTEIRDFIINTTDYYRDFFAASLESASLYLKTSVALEREKIKSISEKDEFLNPKNLLVPFRERAAELEKELTDSVHERFYEKKTKFLENSARLDDLSPLSVLRRGYSSVSREGRIIYNAADLKVGDRIVNLFNDGKVKSEVTEIEQK